ncbi:unnamed protein product [Cylindrotheca closterium]|uniref:Uncharacterized protein n=1 Tax=Cylindrotheca closterium TaxID=2856 RepID=A0AAD2FU83_9STRA|nr:unnamed protein product [Cylindrotheca closterium]
MLSKLGSASRRTFSEKESLTVSEALNDDNDIFITESIENSSVLGNTSYVGHVEAPALPFEDDKDIYAEESESNTVTSTSTDSFGTQPFPAGAGRLSLPQRFTRTIPKRDQLSKLKEDMPWAIYGSDPVSRLAIDALDGGDDIHISASCEQDDFSVVGNSSVAPFEAHSTTSETDKDNYTATIATPSTKTKKGLFRKLSLTKKITRILPSKQYVSKLSRLTEDVPWSMNSQEQISRQADEILNDGDDFFITKSFEPLEADTSSVLGNSSYVSAAKSTPLLPGAPVDEKRDDISAHGPDINDTSRAMNEPKTIRTGIRKTKVSEKLKNAIPAPVTQSFKSAIPAAEYIRGAIPTPVAERLKNVPSSVVSSSQKLMTWRLKSTVKSEYRTPLVSEHQEISDGRNDNAKNLPLDSKYGTSTPESQKKLHPRRASMQVSSPISMGQEIAFPLSTDSESPRSRSLTWDSASCSDMSEITEPSVYSRSRSFRKAHSMFVVQPSNSLLGLGSADEDSEVSMDGNGSITSSSKNRGSRLTQLIGHRSMTNLPNINESKPFNVMSSTEIFSPIVVNSFLNQLETNDKPINDETDTSWDAVSVLGNEDWRPANRQRVSSDSDVVYEFQRQHSTEDIDEAPNQHLAGLLYEVQDDDSLTLFLDNVDSTEESETHAKTEKPTSTIHKQVIKDSEFSAHELHSVEESDFWTATKGLPNNFIDDDAAASWSGGPHFPSNPIPVHTNDGIMEADINFDAVDALWSPRRRFASDPFAASNPAENTFDVDYDSIWNHRPRFASDPDAISDHLAGRISIENTTDSHAIDVLWSHQPRFATDTSFIMDDPNAQKHAVNEDDADYSWGHEPFASNFESTTGNVLDGNVVDVHAPESSWDFSSDIETANDDVVKPTSDPGSKDALWTEGSLYGSDSEVIDDVPTANNSSEDVVAGIAVEERGSETDSSWGQESTFGSEGMVGENDNKGHTTDIDYSPTWTQRPRYSSEPAVFNDDKTVHTSIESTVDIDAAPADASLNPRPRYLSDPVITKERTTDKKIDAGIVDASSSSLGRHLSNRRRFSSKSVTSNNDVADMTAVYDDHESSMRDERSPFSSTSVAINENAANSEIEISLHGSVPSWKWSSTQPNDVGESSLEMTLDEQQGAAVEKSTEITAHDYYWNQSIDSEDDGEEILLSGGKSDSFDDIF